MGIGIDIDVKSEKVAKAQKLIDQMSKSLDEAGGKAEIKIGPETVDITAVNAVSKGASAYRKEMEGAANALNKMVKDYDKLIKMPKSVIGTGAAQVIRPSLAPSGTYAAQNSALQNSIENMFGKKPKHVPFGEQFRRDNPNWRPPGGGGAPDDHSGNHVMFGPGTFKKALGWGLAAAGGFSILGFLSQSRARYQQSVRPEGELFARGITGGSSDGIGLGVGPLEQMQLLESLSRTGTGLSRTRLNARIAGGFSRAMGTDMSSTAGLYSAAYQTSGKTDAATGQLAAFSDAVKRGLDRSKATEFLTLVTRNTYATASALHGGGISPERQTALTNLTLAGMMSGGKSYAAFAKSGEFFNIMQNGFQGAGTPAGDIMMSKALGVFNGPMSWKKLFNVNLAKEGGPLQNPQILKEILGNYTGTPQERAAQLKTFNPSWNLSQTSALKMVEMNNDGFLDRWSKSGKSLAELAKGGDKKASEWLKEYGTNPSAQKEILEAKREQEYINTGEKLNKALGSLESTVLGLTHKLLDSKLADRLVNAMERFGKFAENPAKGTWNAFNGAMSEPLFTIPLPKWLGGKGKTSGMAMIPSHSRADRNNNPGNLKFSTSQKALAAGAVGVDMDGFAIFPDSATGDRARKQVVFGTYRNSKLTDMIAKYAPSSENNTVAYQATVLRAVGGKNKKMSEYTPSEQQKIMDAMKRQEGFGVLNNAATAGTDLANAAMDRTGALLLSLHQIIAKLEQTVDRKFPIVGGPAPQPARITN